MSLCDLAITRGTLSRSAAELEPSLPPLSLSLSFSLSNAVCSLSLPNMDSELNHQGQETMASTSDSLSNASLSVQEAAAGINSSGIEFEAAETLAGLLHSSMRGSESCEVDRFESLPPPGDSGMGPRVSGPAEGPNMGVKDHILKRLLVPGNGVFGWHQHGYIINSVLANIHLLPNIFQWIDARN